MTHLLLSLASHCYIFGALLFVAYFIRASPRIALGGVAAISVGFILHTAFTLHRLMFYAYTTMTSFGEGLAFLGWLLAGGLLLIYWRWRVPVIGVFVSPLVVAVVLPAVLMHQQAGEVPRAVRQAGMPLHVGVSFAGIALFALATGVAGAYLLLERQMKGKRFGVLFSRLPSLEVLDDMGNRLMRWGFVALSFTMISGAWFAKAAWGNYWRWDPKLTLSLVGWLVFAGLVHARLFAGWRGRRAALLTLLGFTILFGSFVGLQLFPTGLHTGAFQ